jgi:hypothetical protein
MQHLKNTSIGFLVSFMGSVPLGYLNVVGYELYATAGLQPTIFYLCGVIAVEAVIIYGSLLFAKQLVANKKILKYIALFSIVFLFTLAYVFYSNSPKEVTHSSFLSDYMHYSPFVIGLILSCFNFIQLPFWTSWNLYLLNENYIEISGAGKYFYLIGTLVGTFSGMMVLVLSLNYLTTEVGFLRLFLFRLIIPLVFIGLGVLQLFKFYKTYCVNKR